MAYWIILEALDVLRAHRLRSVLTMLGIVIGVGAVIVMLAVIAGVSEQYQRQIEGMGGKLLVVYPSLRLTRITGANAGVTHLTTYDATAIAKQAEVLYAAPLLTLSGRATYKAKKKDTTVYATTPAHLAIVRRNVGSGIAFTERDVRTANRVVVLGKTVVNELFGERLPIGETIRLDGHPFRVVGVLESQGGGVGSDLDDCVIVPVRAAHQNLAPASFRDNVSMIEVEARSNAVLGGVQTAVEELLRQRHHIHKRGDEDFIVHDVSAARAMFIASERDRALMLGAIGSISLLVGGIGIMNMMLVSVTERTREIGLRKSIGATRGMIQAQFLAESIVLAVVGCVLGVAIGVAVANLMLWFFKTAIVITSVSIIGAIGVSTAVGIFFGWYPARRAAQLDPVVALRFQ